jgi:hypothetical protein
MPISIVSKLAYPIKSKYSKKVRTSPVGLKYGIISDAVAEVLDKYSAIDSDGNQKVLLCLQQLHGMGSHLV